MYKRILIPLDNSLTDQAILEHIRPLAKLTKASIVLVHVADGFGARLQDQLNLADSEEIKKDEAYLDKHNKKLTSEGFTVKSILVQGQEPGEGILKVAKEEDCDLIAMATHGHGFVQDVILGSVAHNLRHKTDIPILMIRSSAK
jgi:nucleotide-binding universal stress UspA family protein